MYEVVLHGLSVVIHDVCSQDVGLLILVLLSEQHAAQLDERLVNLISCQLQTQTK